MGKKSGKNSKRKSEGGKAETAKPGKAKKLTARQRIAANAKRCHPTKSKGSRRTGKSSTTGRPSAYSKEVCAKVIDFMGRGFSLTAFAGEIGVSRDTIYGWAEAHKEFSDALTRAKAARTLYWEKRLEIAGPDARAVIFALRNSCADEWKQNPDENAPQVNVTVNNEVAVDTTAPPEKWGQAELEAELRKQGVVPITTRTPKGNGSNGTHQAAART